MISNEYYILVTGYDFQSLLTKRGTNFVTIFDIALGICYKSSLQTFEGNPTRGSVG